MGYPYPPINPSPVTGCSPKPSVSSSPHEFPFSFTSSSSSPVNWCSRRAPVISSSPDEYPFSFTSCSSSRCSRRPPVISNSPDEYPFSFTSSSSSRCSWRPQSSPILQMNIRSPSRPPPLPGAPGDPLSSPPLQMNFRSRSRLPPLPQLIGSPGDPLSSPTLQMNIRSPSRLPPLPQLLGALRDPLSSPPLHPLLLTILGPITDALIVNNPGDGGLNESCADGGKPTDTLYDETVSDGWDDPDGKLTNVELMGISASAHNWNSKETSSEKQGYLEHIRGKRSRGSVWC